MGTTFQPQERYDSLLAFDLGMHSGVAPQLLPKNQLAFGVNTTVRGTFVTHRPTTHKLDLTFSDDATRMAFQTGLFQTAGYYRSDSKISSVMAGIAGLLYQITPGTTPANRFTATVADVSIPGDPNPSTLPQSWCWQSEKWLILNNGVNAPIFFDGVSSRRSVYQGRLAGQLAADVTIVAGPNTAVLNQPYTGLNGATVYLGYTQYSFTITGNGSTTVTVTPTYTPSAGGDIFSKDSVFFFVGVKYELPPGRMGCYGMGRNWVCLPDGRQFIAGDLVGGSSGTVAENFRDSVLGCTENTYLAGGGNFQVPGSQGDIRAMIFTATLDVSLGQGPLQVLTPEGSFSCMAPTDRTTWQSVTNPILTESLKTNGALSQSGTVNWNSDILFRSVDGIRSLILGRREFSTWGNTPMSEEMNRVLELDEQALLAYTSAVIFDNRMLHTIAPQTTNQGIYFKGLIALNADPISSIRGKAPSVYDGTWTGLNVLHLVSGLFSGLERCFAIVLNTISGTIEVHEILTAKDSYYDYDVQPVPVEWYFETPVLKFGNDDPKTRQYLRMANGEIFCDLLQGRTDFQVYYRHDQSPCWSLWHQWSEDCCETDEYGNPTRPEYRSRMGLGEPPANVCDTSTKTPFRDGYNFQLKIKIRGHCRFLGGRFMVNTIPEPKFEAPGCAKITGDILP